MLRATRVLSTLLYYILLIKTVLKMIVMQVPDKFDMEDRANYEELLVRWCASRIKRNKNVIMCICGGTGSGKSYAALHIADKVQQRIINEPFKARQVVFTGTEFLQQTEVLKPGSVILWDEIGVGLNSRRAMSNINIALNNKFQVFRHQNYVTILTTPDFGYIDKATRKL